MDERPLSRSDFVIEPFLPRSDAWASWQFLSTLGPIAGLWLMVGWIGHGSLPIGVKALLLLPVLGLLILLWSRSFALMHDCGHNSLFHSRWLNRSAGFLLGVLNAIPQHPWSRGHAYHHKHNGNWQLYRGPSAVLSLKQYQDLSEQSKFIYAISRHPLMLFPGGFFYLVIKPRLTLILGLWEFIWSCGRLFVDGLHQEGWRYFETFPAQLKKHNSSYWYTSGELADLLANNLLVLISWLLMSRLLGAGLFWSCYSVVMTASAAIFICIFFVQHNYEGSYAHGSDDWSYFQAAIEGSSNLEIPSWLNWFFADISFHSIHHLCERIPNYRLRECHLLNQDLLVSAKRLRLRDIPSCFGYILWDSDSQQLITIAESKVGAH